MTTLPADPANPEKKKSPSAFRSILAGAAAGAIEISLFCLDRLPSLYEALTDQRQALPIPPNVRVAQPKST